MGALSIKCEVANGLGGGAFFTGDCVRSLKFVPHLVSPWNHWQLFRDSLARCQWTPDLDSLLVPWLQAQLF